MHYIVDSEKSVDQASADLQEAVVRNHFGVLHIHDLRATMKQKGVEFPHECRIFEVCNPEKAKQALEQDMNTNLVLPCRISVWQQDGSTKIGMLNPVDLLAMISHDANMTRMAREIETVTQNIIDEAK